MNEKTVQWKEYYTHLGLNISMYRKLQNMTQAELAERVGISRTHLSNIEAVNMIPSVSLDVIFGIADALAISPDALFKDIQ